MKKGFGTLLVATLAVTMFVNPSVTPTGSHSSSTQSQASVVSSSPYSGDPLPQSSLTSICNLDDDPLCKMCTQICPARDLLDTIGAVVFPPKVQEPASSTSADGSAERGPQRRRSADSSTRDDLPAQWGVPGHVRGHLHFVLAIVPDPAHTHLSLFFDRQIETIEQAAHQGGYVFARANMPWDFKDHPESPDLRTRLLQQGYQQNKEKLPGLMIFQKAFPSSETEALASLFVFVVGETPTGGINRAQFLNALRAMREIRADSSASLDRLLILGPTFSGSLYSLATLLKQRPKDSFSEIVVHSGTASSWEAIKWFATYPGKPPEMRFQTFQESDRYGLTRLLGFACLRHYRASEIAVLSEDETVYGLEPRPKQEPPTTPTSCEEKTPMHCTREESSTEKLCTPESESELVHLYFPRDISHLRSAYQRDVQNQEFSDNAGRRPARSTLRSNLEDTGNDDDSVAPYSRFQTPLSQEAVLMGLVSNLEKHHVRFVVLRATNPLDTLFLSRYLRIAYPAGRIVTIGSDLLFQRELDDSRLHGVLAITSYSLLPGIGDEMASPESLSGGLHEDRVFPSNYSVGTYNAFLSLLNYPDIDATLGCNCAKGNNKCVDLPVAPYAEYGWPSIGGERDALSCVLGPPLWLTVLGRNGYWPLALLDSESNMKGSLDLSSNVHAVNAAAHLKAFQGTAPLPWKELCGACILIVVSYLVLIWRGSIFTTSESLANFAPVKAPSRNYLLFVADLLVLLLLLSLIWPWVRWTIHFSDSWLGYLLIAIIVVLIPVCSGDLRSRGAARKANCFLVVSVVLTLGAVVLFRSVPGTESSANLDLYRYTHITSGVSQFMPFLLLVTAGLWWFWYSLAGLALMDSRRPRLPKAVDFGPCTTEAGEVMPSKVRLKTLSREANKRLSKVMRPADRDPRVWLLPAVLVLLTAVVMGFAHPFQSLEGGGFDVSYASLLALAAFVLLCTLFRLVITWMEFRDLLLRLDRFPLRRGFERLEGFAWKPIWRLGGSAAGDFLRLISRQTEALVHIKNTGLKDQALRTALNRIEERRKEMASQVHALESLQEINSRKAFASTRGSLKSFWAILHGRRIDQSGPFIKAFAGLQKELSSTCGAALLCLSGRWDTERQVDLLRRSRFPGDKNADGELEEARRTQLVEQFVCLAFGNFILSVLMRMRTMVMTIAGMFIFVLLSFSSYPFEPKSSFYVLMGLLFLIIVGLVGFVFAQMHRDGTLSRMTNTTPGELGIDFWFRLVSFVAVPFLSLLAAQFPEINDFLFSWLQPALQAFK